MKKNTEYINTKFNKEKKAETNNAYFILCVCKFVIAFPALRWRWFVIRSPGLFYKNLLYVNHGARRKKENRFGEWDFSRWIKAGLRMKNGKYDDVISFCVFCSPILCVKHLTRIHDVNISNGFAYYFSKH